MTPKTLMSVEEFTALPDDGMLQELNEGGLITNTARILGIEDTLEAPELLPGFKLQVRAILQ